ncbi:MAG: hypothetical protein AAF821_13190 [Cyanobacteria bacterium P01_D01_bin.156]
MSTLFLVTKGICGAAIATFWCSWMGNTTQAQSLPSQINSVNQINNQQPSDLTPSATADNPSDQQLTIPSLWWQERQQGDAINPRLIDTWNAYESSVIPHVDVLVNAQIWPLLSYLEQYAFITQFGRSAKAYEYQLRVFTGNRLVGSHVCDFTALDDVTSQALPVDLRCVVQLDYLGQGAIRGRRGSVDF